MRLATFDLVGERRVGLMLDHPADAIVDLEAAWRLLDGDAREEWDRPRDMLSLIRAGDQGHRALLSMAGRLAADARRVHAEIPGGARFCPPIARPGKLVCVAGNYRDHVKESGHEVTQESDVITPQLFLKPATTLVGHEQDIVISQRNVAVGWEAELAVIIGREARHVGPRDAEACVFGYTILNDVSERRLNSTIPKRRARESDRFFDWLAGKWFDSFAPCGPWIVTADEVQDPHGLELCLSVNGQVRQQGTTGEMIFRVPELIAYASSIMTLEPGDIIATGTPAGAGIGGEAVLRHGDEVVCEITGVGTLRNRVRYVA